MKLCIDIGVLVSVWGIFHHFGQIPFNRIWRIGLSYAAMLLYLLHLTKNAPIPSGILERFLCLLSLVCLNIIMCALSHSSRWHRRKVWIWVCVCVHFHLLHIHFTIHFTPLSIINLSNCFWFCSIFLFYSFSYVQFLRLLHRLRLHGSIHHIQCSSAVCMPWCGCECGCKCTWREIISLDISVAIFQGTGWTLNFDGSFSFRCATNVGVGVESWIVLRRADWQFCSFFF